MDRTGFLKKRSGTDDALAGLDANSNYFKAAELFLLIYTFECVVGGSGRWLAFGPVSIRMVLFALCFVVSLPLVIRRGRCLWNWKYLWGLALFLIYLVFEGLFGWFNGNQLGFIRADVTSFLALFLVPAYCVVFSGKARIKKVVDVIYWGAALTALATVVLYFVLAFMSVDQITIVNNWINARYLGGVAQLTGDQQRVFFRSQIFLQVALIIGLWKCLNADKKKRGLLCVANGLMSFAIILSLARALWVGLVVGLILFVIAYRQHLISILKEIGAILLVLVVMIVLSCACYQSPGLLTGIVARFDPSLTTIAYDGHDEQATSEREQSIENEYELANENAVAVRSGSISGGLAAFSHHPLLGNGLGFNLDEVRDDGKIEYMYLDILMKMGVIGLVLFLLVFLLVPIKLYFNRVSSSAKQDGCFEKAIGAAYLSVAVSSFFNPFLSGPMGICLLCVCCALHFTDKQGIRLGERNSS